MTPEEYVKLAVRTEAPQTRTMGIRAINEMRLLHAVIGLCTETGELQDALKKHIFYDKPIDYVNVREELGDVMWYVALMCDALDVRLEDVMIANIDKLKCRYPERFTNEKANVRDLDAERRTLEGGQ